jgi:hypothetical protein
MSLMIFPALLAAVTDEANKRKTRGAFWAMIVLQNDTVNYDKNLIFG